MTKIITIDGPAASGKGTLARRLAEHLGYFYLDTGKIYRLVGLAAKAKGIVPEEAPDDVADLARELAENFDIALMNNPDLKSDEAGQMASRVAPFPVVRAAILDLQRELAHRPPSNLKGTVMDGRDCGTVLCPDASYKFYIIADAEIRAKRRFNELKSRGDATSFDKVLKDLQERDARDMEREHSPTKPAADAEIIDTSAMDAEAAFQTVLKKLN